MFLEIPVIFLCVMIFCPPGIYYLVKTDGIFFSPPLERIDAAKYITIEFFIIQFIIIGIMKAIKKLRNEQINDEKDKK